MGISILPKPRGLRAELPQPKDGGLGYLKTLVGNDRRNPDRRTRVSRQL